MRPSIIKSSRAAKTWRVDKGTAMPFANGGSACAIITVHTAISGQSWHPLLFCCSEQQFMPSAMAVGQQGISPDMTDIFIAEPAAAGVASGAATSPAITITASKRPMSRHKFITYHHTRRGTWEGRSLHKFANKVSKTLQKQLVNFGTALLSAISNA